MIIYFQHLLQMADAQFLCYKQMFNIAEKSTEWPQTDLKQYGYVKRKTTSPKFSSVSL